MKNRLLLICFASVLTACASGPISMGKDTYMMTDTGAWSWSSGSTLKANLYREANEFCESKGKDMLPVGAQHNHADFSTFARAELQFRCVDKRSTR